MPAARLVPAGGTDCCAWALSHAGAMRLPYIGVDDYFFEYCGVFAIFAKSLRLWRN